MQSATVALRRIKTDRLTLRPVRSEDVDDYFAFASEPEYAFFAFREEVSREFVQRFLQVYPRLLVIASDVHRSPRSGDGRFRSTGYRLDGSCGVTGVWVQTIALGQRSCDGSSGGCRLVRFQSLKLEKVWARADPRNIASVRVLEKLGMRCEGVLRRHFVRRGERVDRVYYGLLRDEWLSNACSTS